MHHGMFSGVAEAFWVLFVLVLVVGWGLGHLTYGCMP